MWWLTLLGKLPLVGQILQWLGGLALQFYSAKLGAKDTHEQKQVVLAQSALELDKREAELASAEKAQIRGKPWEIENLLGYLVFAFLLKAIGWDNVVGSFFAYDPPWLFYTHPLTGLTGDAFVTVMTFWVGGRSALTIARTLATVWKKG